MNLAELKTPEELCTVIGAELPKAVQGPWHEIHLEVEVAEGAVGLGGEYTESAEGPSKDLDVEQLTDTVADAFEALRSLSQTPKYKKDFQDWNLALFTLRNDGEYSLKLAFDEEPELERESDEEPTAPEAPAAKRAASKVKAKAPVKKAVAVKGAAKKPAAKKAAKAPARGAKAPARASAKAASAKKAKPAKAARGAKAPVAKNKAAGRKASKPAAAKKSAGRAAKSSKRR